MVVKIELSGGLEYDAKTTHFEIEIGNIKTMRDVIHKIKEIQTGLAPIFTEESVIPGIIVLINDADWELVGMLDSEVHDGDVISLISSIHGG
ncbi:Urm1 (Ubiquitin related modifier), putative [Entamoeba histolytica HM-1:IMSS-B]|uniref:Ubiquitin-related modifier 1 homolog n=8 Tax=Entamoeba TaxID=5758 RepID=C4M0R7_ENTH1|nr:uncharacterized protein EDI_107190 [Entamoeba dispar SAW760]XP_657081.1 hypothetical protein EHI_010030 [Entamoeba histolytica HM-1:IMSS]EMD43570.1 ubiquitinrelated modifier 1 family protein [Entamoeba histolytica KU27]EMH75726.1 Urm1 (Ubiquitin related modifier), putative [Entamoeba histolytica HM-1:IMSS-B]EMS17485.1 Ubiquitin-related modifier 1 family protein [Entamoeba histolytica HM-3:IMSS]ENY61773.1 Ubiquitin-related modifier 1 family protein, putative [Entamoeba histolytica HM-1:IMSS-|eukprot:EDR27147.1 hypothetical protein, conserved [Entamoeba dispar SAW760]